MYDYNRIKNHVNGVESSSYELFGAKLENGGVFFTVYAPSAHTVSLCANFNEYNEIPMNKDDFGVWNVFIGGVGEGLRYKYRIYSDSENFVEKSDPFAYYNESHTNESIVYDINNYTWRDAEWISKRNKNYNLPLNIYEVHLGSWKVKDGKEGSQRYYEYEELKNELVPYVKEMGYTHIEFMPLCEYPFGGSWGYQGTGYYASTSRFGEPRYLMDLIDTCHINGIGVILDIVPVHYAEDSFGLRNFDGGCLYESDNPDLQRSEWGSYRFDYSKPHVHSFMRSAVNFWINYYHFDGIRFDAVGYLIYPNGVPDAPEYDGGVWFLKNTLFTMNAYHPDVMFIAEDAACHAKDTAPVVYGGMGFDYMWNFGWSADTRRYISMPYDQRTQNHNLMTYPMYYFNHELFMLTISHDDVSAEKESVMTKTFGNTPQEKLACLRTYYTYQITHPGKKMNFMGNELAELMGWTNNQPPCWDLLEDPDHKSFHEYIKQLNHVYKNEPSLYAQEYHSGGFSWVDLDNWQNSIYAYRRDDFQTEPLFVVLNFSNNQHEYYLNVGFEREFEEVLNSDKDIYGGANITSADSETKNCYLKINMAPLSAIILRPLKEKEPVVEEIPEEISDENKTEDEITESVENVSEQSETQEI